MFEVFEIELGIKMNCNDMKLIVIQTYYIKENNQFFKV